jgi:dissimilatory sulfite reductase (desulfoviridin) alpha/beta subunit
VVEVDAGDDRAVGVDDVHRVEPAAQADLEDRHVRLLAGGHAGRMASVVNSK